MKTSLAFLLWFMLSIYRIDAAPVPTILDTDIGDDYDDQMALTFILSNPTIFDLKLVICSTYNTSARGQIAAKTLSIFGRFDVPVALGVNTGTRGMAEYDWARDYTLDQFQKDGGTVYENGEEALLKEMQKANPNNIYNIIEISPETSLGHVVQRLPPENLQYFRLFAMAGSIYRGYRNASHSDKEYNIYVDVGAAKAVFNASWGYFGLAPLDTTVFVQFNGPEWETFYGYRNRSKHVQLIIDSYTVWYNNGGKGASAILPFSPETGTSTMYDVLAAFLASCYPATLTMVSKELPLVITNDGFTAVNATLGKPVNSTLDFLTPNPYTSTELIGITVLDSIIYSK